MIRKISKCYIYVKEEADDIAKEMETGAEDVVEDEDDQEIVDDLTFFSSPVKRFPPFGDDVCSL